MVRGGRAVAGGNLRLCGEGFGEIVGFLGRIRHDGAGDAGDDQFADAEFADVGGVIEVDGAVVRGSGELNVVLGEEVGNGDAC